MNNIYVHNFVSNGYVYIHIYQHSLLPYACIIAHANLYILFIAYVNMLSLLIVLHTCSWTRALVERNNYLIKS